MSRKQTRVLISTFWLADPASISSPTCRPVTNRSCVMTQADKKSEYFRLDPKTSTERQGRYVIIEQDLPVVKVAKGLDFRPLVGQNVLVNFVRCEPNSAPWI